MCCKTHKPTDPDYWQVKTMDLHTEPSVAGAERVLKLEDRVQRLEIADLRHVSVKGSRCLRSRAHSPAP